MLAAQLMKGNYMRVLNLYAGLGGNRKLWEDCEVVAVEMDERIAAVYQRLHPNDTVIIGDAHQYLLDNHEKFDFVWSSPPLSDAQQNGKGYPAHIAPLR